jgi:anion-transporting  ArsA/GET3 family ATPase
MDHFDLSEPNLLDLPKLLESKVDEILKNHEFMQDEFKQLIPNYDENSDLKALETTKQKSFN